MKDTLPPDHGLSHKLLKSTVFSADGVTHSLTDIQYEALAAGVARGKSLVVVAPTSSGKTNVGLGGLISWIEGADLSPRKAIYLTSHRALARQKYNEFVPLLGDLLGMRTEDIVLSTGDGTVDASGQSPSDPADATVLIATYEKYLGLLSGAGVPEDLTHICFVCDELQIINDRHRGEAVEILLTLLRRARFGQLIGLSAVIAPNDAKALSDWLGTQLVRTANREVPITYELRSATQTISVDTDEPQTPRVRSPSLNTSTWSFSTS